MNLNRFIENLQSKPRTIRIQILIGSVFICMIFVIWVWAASLNLSQEASPKGTGQASGESTLEQLKGVGKEAFRSLEDFKTEFEDLNKAKQLEQEEVEPVRLPVE